MHAANRVFNNTLILYVKMFITVIPSLYTTRILLSELGVDDFGILNLAIGFMAMLNFFNAALSSSSLRYMAHAKGRNDFDQELKVFNITLILHLFLAIFLACILLSATPLIVNDFLNIKIDRLDATNLLLNSLIIGMFFTVLSVPYDALINSYENMFFVAVIGILESLLRLSAAIYISFVDNDQLVIYGYLLILISILLFLAKIVFVHLKYTESKINFKKYFDTNLFKEILSFSSYNVLGISFQMVSFYGQGILLNIFFGTVVNAAQGIVNQISGQLSSFANTMQKALNPMMIKTEGAGNRQQMLESAFSGNRLAFFMIMFFYIPVLMEMETILDLWLVTVPPFTVIFAQLYFVANLIDQLYLTLGTAIKSVGRIKHFQIYSSIVSSLPLPITYILFKNDFPPETIYVIFIAHSMIQGTVHILIAKKECQMSLKHYASDVMIKSMIPFIFIFTIVMIPHWFIHQDYYRLLGVFTLNLIAFVPAVWFFGLRSNEKMFLIAYVKKFKKG